MIAFVLKTFLLAGLAVLIAWGWVLVRRSPSQGSLKRESRTLSRLVPDTQAVRDLEASASRLVQVSERLLPASAGRETPSRLRGAMWTAGLHLAIALEILPILVPLLASGITLGLALREACRHGLRFASPTRAYLAKHLFGASFLLLVLFAVTPISLPYWTLWADSLAMSGGMFTYVANMPIKL